MLTTEIINSFLGIKESYQASSTLMNILMDKETREELFRKFLEYETDVSFDWFHVYFEEEHANKKKYAQDFTPNAISQLVSQLVSKKEENGMVFESACGTGGMIIKKWNDDRMKESPFTYKPSEHFFMLEELSDNALPFLLFNLAIRGMNATVFHGDSLSRECKQVYFVQNSKDDHMCFSDINIMPRTKEVEQEFNVLNWVGEEHQHIESKLIV